MNSNLLQLIIAGFGGQGVLFTGRLLAYSAMLEGKEVSWFPSYGAEMRGGAANCTVIISDEMIGSPVVNNPNILLVMNETSMQRFGRTLKAGGILIMNASLLKGFNGRPDVETVQIKATDIAERLGNNQVANMVMLGALIGKTGVVSLDSALNALREMVPKHKKDIIIINETALRRGIKEIVY
ncbi:MAG: 2-oxoacid:acceptor oxidoreductase family protein [Nitrospirae bacterium]|nr:2-oxoacid:acceptor oxidoreductase family protein [Nitrospirota bacterium]